MTFEKCLKYCMQHRYSPRAGRHYIPINIGIILILAIVVGGLYSVLLDGTGVVVTATLALAGGVIIWFGAMLEMAMFIFIGSSGVSHE